VKDPIRTSIIVPRPQRRGRIPTRDISAVCKSIARIFSVKYVIKKTSKPKNILLKKETKAVHKAINIDREILGATPVVAYKREAIVNEATIALPPLAKIVVNEIEVEETLFCTPRFILDSEKFIGVAKNIFPENRPAIAAARDLYIILYGFSLKPVVMAKIRGSIPRIAIKVSAIRARTKVGATKTVASSCSTAKNDAVII